jgi:hypothetical protein
MRARAMRIEARLPEAMKAAAYIINRSPTKTLNGMTPHEKLNRLLRPNDFENVKPNTAHLKVYGCRVYVRKNKVQISRKEKMVHKSMIGYLVGYKASNISRVWMPEQGKVVEIRDGDFDEHKLYDPEMPFIESELTTASPIKQATVQIPTYKGDLTQFRPIEDSSEDEDTLTATESESGADFEKEGIFKANQQNKL